MADWLKVEKTLPDKLEVLQLAGMLGLSEDEVVGKLFRFWCWVDDNLKDCNAYGVTFVTIDRIANCKNFAAGLVKVGWLEGREGRLSIPHFDRHFGQSAKMRAVTNKRVKAYREARKNTPEMCNDSSVTNVTLEALPEEKRKEYSNTMVSGSTTVNDAPAVMPPALPDDDGFCAWLKAMCCCVPQLAAFRVLPQDVVAAARETYRCLPQAVEHAPMLTDYYADRMQQDRYRQPFWRPMGAQFFRELGDVIFKHAQRWAREVGWKKKRDGSKPAAPKPSPPVEAMSEAERAAAFAEIRREAGL